MPWLVEKEPLNLKRHD